MLRGNNVRSHVTLEYHSQWRLDTKVPPGVHRVIWWGHFVATPFCDCHVKKAQWETLTCKRGELKNIYMLHPRVRSYCVIMANEQQNLSPRLQIKQLSLLLCSYNSVWTSFGAKAWLSFRKQVLVFIGWFVSKSLCFRRIEFSTLFQALAVWIEGIQITKINFLWDSGANSIIYLIHLTCARYLF